MIAVFVYVDKLIVSLNFELVNNKKDEIYKISIIMIILD